MKPPFAVLREMGFKCLKYNDDTIFLRDDIYQAIAEVTQLFDRWGLTVHVKKSVFTPVQRIEYLGFELDSTNMTVTLIKTKK